jgi:hypothetical protein
MTASSFDIPSPKLSPSAVNLGSDTALPLCDLTDEHDKHKLASKTGNVSLRPQHLSELRNRLGSQPISGIS